MKNTEQIASGVFLFLQIYTKRNSKNNHQIVSLHKQKPPGNEAFFKRITYTSVNEAIFIVTEPCLL
jgi:hypothetical protein